MTDDVYKIGSPAGDSLLKLRSRLLSCRACPEMVGPVVAGASVESRVLLLGQAPGPHEGSVGRPFAWTAGKTLFQWLARIGIEEETFRSGVYMAAVCRCFPGKSSGGGDRVPSLTEIKNCSQWLHAEVEMLQPRLLIPVGKLAISQVLQVRKLTDVVGLAHRVKLADIEMDTIPLPHPSGASTWHRTEPGISLLKRALALIEEHPEVACLRAK